MLGLGTNYIEDLKWISSKSYENTHYFILVINIVIAAAHLAYQIKNMWSIKFFTNSWQIYPQLFMAPWETEMIFHGWFVLTTDFAGRVCTDVSKFHQNQFLKMLKILKIFVLQICELWLAKRQGSAEVKIMARLWNAGWRYYETQSVKSLWKYPGSQTLEYRRTGMVVLINIQIIQVQY